MVYISHNCQTYWLSKVDAAAMQHVPMEKKMGSRTAGKSGRGAPPTYSQHMHISIWPWGSMWFPESLDKNLVKKNSMDQIVPSRLGKADL